MNAVAHSIYNEALSTATERAGSPAKLAAAIGVSLHKVAAWIGGADVNAETCPTIEQATGVTCEELRPDLLWVRDATKEVLAYAVPVDGADASYVRQALRSDGAVTPPPAPTAKRGVDLSEAKSIADSGLFVCGHVGGAISLTIDNGLSQGQIRLDPSESAMVAGAILSERARVMPTITEGHWEELADIPHELLPLSVKLEEDGVWKRVHLTSPESEQLAVYTPMGQRNYWCDFRVGDSSFRLSRQEADALAMALTGGNDGSAIAHASSRACADMQEAISVLTSEAIADNGGRTVAAKLAMRVNTLLDMYPHWRQRTLLTYGKIGDATPPAQHVADKLADVAHKATDTLARLQAMIQRDKWVDGNGYPVCERGIYGELIDTGTDIRKAVSDMHKREHKSETTVEWRDPLQAKSLKDDDSDTVDMTNVRWNPSPEATVADCLEEATLTLRNACQIILSNSYDESEDTMSILLGIAKSSVSQAHSKLLQFANDWRPEA